MPLFVNRVMLAGNLTRDPDIRFFANERAVCTFSIAINRRYRDNAGEQKEETTFVDVDCWGKTAELCNQYLKKGRNVHIEGRLRLDKWQDRDGQPRSKLKVSADHVNFIDSGNRQQGGNQGNTNGQAASDPSAPAVPPPADLGDDEPPF